MAKATLKVGKINLSVNGQTILDQGPIEVDLLSPELQPPRGEATRKRLQALWDKLCPREPRKIEKRRLTIYPSRPRWMWIATRRIGSKEGFVELGSNAKDAVKTIRFNARWK
jgi:hypothetical protein